MANEVFDSIRKQLETQLNTWWASNGGSVPIEWENVAFNQPSDSTWIRVAILFGTGEQASIGVTKLEKQPGLVVVSCFAPKNEGAKTAYDLADKAGRALRYQKLTDGTVTIHVEAPYITKVPREESHFMVNVNVPFEAQHVTTNE